VREIVDVVKLITITHGIQSFPAHFPAGYLCSKIAENRVGCPHVATNNCVQRFIRFATFVQFKHRNPKPFLVNIPRTGPDTVATDVSVMNGRSAIANQGFVAEYWCEYCDVKEMSG